MTLQRAGEQVRGRLGRLSLLRLTFFGVALAAGLIMVLGVWHAQSAVAQANDIYKFAELGRNIVEGNGFCFDAGPPAIRRAPLYPGLIAALYWAFGERPLAIQIFQCFLSGGICVLVFEIGRRVFSLRTGMIAASIIAIHPMVLRYVPDIQVETVLTFFYTLTVYRTVRLVEHDSVSNGLLLGVSAAAAAMVKGVALPYAALFIVSYLLWRRLRTERRSVLPGWKPVAAMLAGMALVILPWTYRNYKVTNGQFVLISGNASGEFLRGYIFAQPRYLLLRDPAYSVGENEANAMQRDLFRSQGLVWERDEAETERVQNIALKKKLRDDPAAFVKKAAMATLMFWYVVTSRTNSLVVGGLALLAWILAIVGWVRERHKGYPFWLLMVPIASLNAIYALVLALGRYSAPCIPTLVVLAAFGIESLLGRQPPDGNVSSDGIRSPA